MSGEISYKTHILIGVRANGVMTVIADWPHVPKQANVEKEIDARSGRLRDVRPMHPDLDHSGGRTQRRHGRSIIRIAPTLVISWARRYRYATSQFPCSGDRYVRQPKHSGTVSYRSDIAASWLRGRARPHTSCACRRSWEGVGTGHLKCGQIVRTTLLK